MDQFKINGPQDYSKYFHTNSEGLVWVDGRGNPIPLDVDLSSHVDCKSPDDLWNNRKTRQGLCSKDLPAQGRGPTNSMATTQNIPPLTEPISPILPRDPPGDDDVVESILMDPNIDQGLLGAAISQLPPHLSSRFVAQKSALLSHWPGSAENPPQVLPQSQASAPPSESPTPNMSHKLVEENNRLREEFDRFKRDLDAQHKIELASQKKNLERQYEQETQNTVAKLRQDLDNTQRLVDNRLVETETLQHQTKTLEEQVKALREENERLKQQPPTHLPPPPTYHSQHQTPHVSFAPPTERHLTATHRSHKNSMAQTHTHNASMDNSLTMVLDRFERSLTLQNNAIQESLALSANSFREHYLSSAKPCDGKDPKEFEHWLDDVQGLATLTKKSPEDVALATSRGSLHRYVREPHNYGSTLEDIKTQLQGTFSDYGSSTIARHKLQYRKQDDMPIHEYISKFTNLVEHAYGLSSHAHSSFILASTFIEGIMSPHIRNKLRSCKGQSLKDVFS